MTDEIKEILDRLDYNEWEVALYKVPINWCELYDIRDYITNLQEEIEILNNIIDELEKENNKLRSMLLESIEVTNKAINIIDKEILQGEEK